jgi:DNA-binding transcriptional ArsR family regulator
MKKERDHADNEFREIKAKLDEVRNDLKRFIEQSNKQQLDFILASSRKEVASALVSHMAESVEEGLDSHMVKQCEMRETCKAKLGGILMENAGALGQVDGGRETLEKNKALLDAVKGKAQYKKCNVCLSEAYTLYDRQVDLMQKLSLYDGGARKAPDITAMPEEGVVTGFLEPVSNETRLRILKSLYYEPRTFSALSKLTGLRAGNLLFHLQKLQRADMVIQRHEGGDYLITEKGFRMLNSLYDIWENDKYSPPA